jgi:hypothetical protein
MSVFPKPPQKERHIGRPKMTAEALKAKRSTRPKLQIQAEGEGPIGFVMKQRVDCKADLDSMRHIAKMLYEKMKDIYISSNTLTDKATELGWQSVEQAEKELLKSIQERLNPNIDWDDESWLYK